MTFVKWTPKVNMMNIFDEVEHMMHQVYDNSFKNAIDRQAYMPFMDLNESNSDYLIKMDLPGVEKKDVEVSLSDGALTISGERKTSENDSEKKQICNETAYGTFSRSFELASDIREEKIKAKFKNGVLSITIPKAEEVTPTVKQISVS